MLMRIDYDKLIKKYFADEKMYMFTKLVFSKKICVLLYLNILLESKPYPHDYIHTAWGGGGWRVCMHVLVCMCVCASACACAMYLWCDFLYVCTFVCVCVRVHVCACVGGGGGGGGE